MAIDLLSELAQTAIPTAIIIWLLWFITDKVWPWWTAEREHAREYSNRRQANELVTDLEMSNAIKSLSVSSDAILSVAEQHLKAR